MADGRLGLVAAGMMLVLVGAVWKARPVVTAEMSPQRCGSCHAAAVSDWSESRHHVAETNAPFQVSWAQTRHPWCLECHGASAREDGGVDCLACHLDGDELVSTEPGLLAQLAHPIRHAPELADERLCARCHQFNQPLPGSVHGGGALVFSDTPAQDTVGEWRRSSAAGEGEGVYCQDCHMPDGSHTFRGAYDVTLLEETLTVSVTLSEDEITAVVSARGVGHAVPTGDPFRRLRWEVCADRRCEVVLEGRQLHRWVRWTGSQWEVIEDTRIPPPTRGDVASVTLVVDRPAELSPGASWRLVYHYIEPVHEAALPDTHVTVTHGIILESADALDLLDRL